MIYRLIPGKYEKVQPLFAELEWNLIITAVFEGTCPGGIYVDDSVNPKAALIVSPEGYYLAGYAHNDEFNRKLKQLFDEVIIPEKIKEGEENISLNYSPPAWEDNMEIILGDKFPLKVHGYYYKFGKLRIDWREIVPPGFSMVQIDEDLLGKTDLKNSGEVLHWAKKNWKSTDNFLKRGFGFCLFCEDTIVSWCLADCVSGSRCEIGIETDENYRRRGFATATVAAAVEYCLSHGFTEIGWHTGTTNVGSYKTAEKVGFVRVLEDEYYFSWFYPVDNFIEHGYFSWLDNNFRESAEWFERAIAVAESGEYDSFQIPRHTLQSICFYAACSWARVGEKDASFTNLYKAAKAGEDPEQFAERLKSSESLEIFQGTEEWKKLLRAIEE